LKIARQKEKDEYQSEKIKLDKMLTERKNEIAEMKKQVAETPNLVSKKVQEAEENLAKELLAKYQLQPKELSVNNENEAKIAEIKIANLETTIKNQTQEIVSLKTELSKVNSMLKEMAVSLLNQKNHRLFQIKIRVKTKSLSNNCP